MGLFWVIVAIVIISTIVGAVSKFFNNLNEMNNAARQRAPMQPGVNKPAGVGPVRQASSDMDRFLAEIDRLRKKTADAPPPPANQTPVVPVVQPVKQPDRPRTRVVAELADAPKADGGFTQSFPTAIVSQRITEVPTAVTTVTAPSSGTGAPATRVTRLASRPRPVAKTPFARSLTGLLNSGQGLAMAIVLQEVLGPPKIKKKG